MKGKFESDTFKLFDDAAGAELKGISLRMVRKKGGKVKGKVYDRLIY